MKTERDWVPASAAIIVAMMAIRMSSLGFSPLLAAIQKEIPHRLLADGPVHRIYGLIAMALDRYESPPKGFSTLLTRAPRPAGIRVAKGPASAVVRSRKAIASKGVFCISLLAVVCARPGGDKEAAEKLYREALDRQQRILGPEHPDTLLTMNNLGLLWITLPRECRASVAGAAKRQGRMSPGTSC